MSTLFEHSWRERASRAIDIGMSLVASVALVSLILEYGGYLSPENIATIQRLDMGIIGLFVLDMVVKFLIARERLRYLRQHLLRYILFGLLLLWLLLARELHHFPAIEGFLTVLNIRSVAKLYIIVIQLAMVLRLTVDAVEAQRKLAHTRFRPTYVLVAGYLFIILIGTVLLYGPHATPGRGHASFIDALFTATSACCVTGLTVQNIGTYFSPFGQAVLLVLIQIGGLGLMIFAALLVFVLGTGTSIRDRMVMQEVLNEQTMGQVVRLVVYVLLLTFVIEAAGAALLYHVWQGSLTSQDRIYSSVFHSVSAFCNAGFGLYRTSFTGYRASVSLNAVICLLIVLGGLGFSVHLNLLRMLRSAWARLPLPFGRRRLFESPERIGLTLQSRLVLITTVTLILGGALVVYLFERQGVLAGMPLGEKALASTFQSVTARTAGFNTIDTSKLSNASLVFVCFLMFIGASPGSTGGGIKTVTFAVLLTAVVTVVRNRPSFELFHRTIPRTALNHAVVVVTVSGLVVAAATTLLCWVEQESSVSVGQAMFEVFSAFGTVGLSTGITRQLTSAGKLIIILTMLVGRIGPLTLVLASGQRAEPVDYEYPEEHVMIG